MTGMNEQPIFVGTGNRSPSLLFRGDPLSGESMTLVSSFPRGHSVYAIAASPNGLYAAAGTKAGLIRVFELTGFRAQPNALAVFEMYHNAAVLALAFLTDDYLASGGMDGRIKVWSISRNKLLGDFHAHAGGVFALCALGSLVLASLGADEKLRLWDMNTLTVIRGKGPIPIPAIHGLISLTADPDAGILLHPSRNGELFVYDLRRESLDPKTVPAHQGDFCAAAVGGARSASGPLIATGGVNDRKIRIWSSALDARVYEGLNESGVASLCWCGDDELFVASLDGQARIWKLNNALRSGPLFSDRDIRSCATLPLELIRRHRRSHDREWRERKLNEADELIRANSPDSQDALFRILEDLESRGFAVESAILFSRYARVQRNPLWELETRLKLVQVMGEMENAVASWYALGCLLIELDEPLEAKRYLEKAAAASESYRDAKVVLERLACHPLLSVDYQTSIHGDLASKDSFAEEMEKYAILGKKFHWKALIKTAPPFELKVQPGLDECWKLMREKIRQSGFTLNEERSGLKRFSLYRNRRFQDVDWIYLALDQQDIPLGCGIERRTYPTGSEWIVNLVFDPGLSPLDETLSIKDHNRRIQDAWSRLHTEANAKWCDSVIAFVTGVIRMQARITLAHAESEF